MPGALREDNGSQPDFSANGLAQYSLPVWATGPAVPITPSLALPEAPWSGLHSCLRVFCVPHEGLWSRQSSLKELQWSIQRDAKMQHQV